MPRLPRITSEATLRALRAAGWHEGRRRGSHVILHHASRPGRVTVPVHAGVILKPKTLLSILEQAGVSVGGVRESALMEGVMRAYSIVVDPDPEGGFTMTVPSLPGCITQ